jgi:hypothetical protein
MKGRARASFEGGRDFCEAPAVMAVSGFGSGINPAIRARTVGVGWDRNTAALGQNENCCFLGAHPGADRIKG